MKLLNLLRAPLFARNPNLQVSIAHAWHVCSQHSTKNERNMITGVAFAPSITRNNARFDPHHVKLAQSKALEQEHFDLRSKA